jgi:hypothetical protein
LWEPVISPWNAKQTVGASLLAKSPVQTAESSRPDAFLSHITPCLENPPRLQESSTDKAVFMISMSSFHAMLIPILSGMILLAIGFNFRDKNAGVFAMWIGMLMILATVVYKILAKLNE